MTSKAQALHKHTRPKVVLTIYIRPNMPATHRPDFAGLRDGCKRHRKLPNKDAIRKTHLWPFINLEDLEKPEVLMVYLHARSRNLPCKFAFADRLSAHIEKPPKNQEVDRYHMLLHERKSPKTYGAFEVHEEHERVTGRDIPKNKLGFPPYVGIQVLEIQAQILDFLVDCCHLVLRDHNLSSIHVMPTTPSVVLKTSTLASGTITALAAEAPYRLPQKLDLKRLLTIVSARREQAEDHVWALREEPSYFVQEMENWSAHAASRILNKFKKPHNCVGTPAFWGSVNFEMITNAYTSLIMWDNVYLLLRQLCASQHYGRSLNPSKRLHFQLESSFMALDLMIAEMKNWPMYELSLGFCASPPLRSGYQRGEECSPNFHQIKPGGNQGQGEKLLHDLFKALFDPLMHKIHGLSNIVDEIQRTINMDRGLVSPWVSARFADLAMIVEISRQLDMFQPWANAWRPDSFGKQIGSAVDIEEISYLRDLLDCQFNVLCTIDPSRLAYPCDKLRTQATVKQMRTSECFLDVFWEMVDEGAERLYAHSLHELVGRHMDESDRLLQRTPRWVASKITVSSNKANKSPDAFDDVLRTKFSLPLLDVDPNARHARPSKASIMSVQTPKPKVKTHGLATPTPRETSSDVPDKTAKVDNGKRFTINKRASKVFGLLFYDPDEHHHAGEILWTDFLYAMSALDFSFEKLYGSSWQFTPPVAEGMKQQPIQFHDPHPQPKLRIWEAKRIGRRLHKTYGWHGKMFVCK